MSKAPKSAFTQTGKRTENINAKLRFSRKEDVQDILDFYGGNLHEHVHIRDKNLLAQRVKDGHFLILKDKDSGEILASSGSYDYRVRGDEMLAQASYAEIGSTRFGDKVAGFGLYPLFIASQVLHGMLTNPPKLMYIANVYDDSPVGRELLTKKVGWQVINATPGILETFKATKAAQKTAGEDNDDERPMTWYGSPSSCLGHQAKIVMSFMMNRTITHKKNGTTLALDLSEFDLAQTFRYHLSDLTMGDWDYLTGAEGSPSNLSLDFDTLSYLLNRKHNTLNWLDHPYAKKSVLKPLQPPKPPKP